MFILNWLLYILIAVTLILVGLAFWDSTRNYSNPYGGVYFAALAAYSFIATISIGVITLIAYFITNK